MTAKYEIYFNFFCQQVSYANSLGAWEKVKMILILGFFVGWAPGGDISPSNCGAESGPPSADPYNGCCKSIVCYDRE